VELNAPEALVEVNKIRASIKEHYHDVCVALHDLNEKEAIIELSSALGCLELDTTLSNGVSDVV